LDEGEEGGAELFVAGGDAPELLVEEALDQVALSIELFVPAIAPPAVGLVGDVGRMCALIQSAS
jgi:hypothetical protein